MQERRTFSAIRKAFLPTSALVAITLAGSMVDAQTVLVQSVGASGDTPTLADNDLTRLQTAIGDSASSPGVTIQLEGVFDLDEANASSLLTFYGAVLPDGMDGVTITGISPDAAIRKSVDESQSFEPAFYQLQSTTITDVTISNLKVEGFNYGSFFWGNTSGLTMDGVHFVIPGNAGGSLSTAARFEGSSNTNMTIRNCTFEVLANSNTLLDANDDVTYAQTRTLWFRNNGNAGLDGLVVEDNDFIVSVDPTKPGGTAPFYGTNQIFFIFDNSTQSNADMTFRNNTFDGGVADGGDVYSLGYTGILTGSKSGEYYEPARPHTVLWEGNTFQNLLTAVDVAWVWDPADPEDVIILRDTTFTNVGHMPTPTVLPFHEDMLPDSSLGGRQAIRNTRANFGVAGPKKVYFEFPLEVNGAQDIEALHALANEGIFDSLDDGEGGFVESGITAARVIPEAPVVAYDPSYTGLPWFSAPGGDTSLAIGYNAIGDELPQGDPNDIDNTYADNDVILIPEGGTLEVAPGSIIGKTLTFRTDRSKSAGPSANPGTIVPTNPNFTDSLFLVQAGGELNLEDVVISGNNAGIAGTRNVLQGVNFDGAGTVNMTNVQIRDFINAAIESENGGTVNVTDSIISNSSVGVVTRNGATVNVAGSIFEGLGLVINIRKGDLSLTGNWFRNNLGRTIFDNSRADNLTMTGNLFFQPFTWTIDGAAQASGTVDISGNWHANIFGAGPNEADGYTTGTMLVRNSSNNINDGVRTYSAVGATTAAYSETNIVAQYDRSNSGVPDVVKLALGIPLSTFSSNVNGIPDGVMLAAGLAVDSSDIPAGWTGSSLAEDGDANRYADWYEDSLAVYGLSATLGDLTGSGSVSLGDAIRALQLLNGAIGFHQIPNGNNLNVTGVGALSLANALQILRFQAGARSTFPAVAGIN